MTLLFFDKFEGNTNLKWKYKTQFKFNQREAQIVEASIPTLTAQDYLYPKEGVTVDYVYKTIQLPYDIGLRAVYNAQYNSYSFHVGFKYSNNTEPTILPSLGVAAEIIAVENKQGVVESIIKHFSKYAVNTWEWSKFARDHFESTLYDILTKADQNLGAGGSTTYSWNDTWGDEEYTAYSESKKMEVNSSISVMATKLPGVETVVNYPCQHHPDRTGTLYYIIIHLNDECNWSREAIADWVDVLHDSGILNAEFQPWEEDLNLT